jgi:peroxiredoxin
MSSRPLSRLSRKLTLSCKLPLSRKRSPLGSRAVRALSSGLAHLALVGIFVSCNPAPPRTPKEPDPSQAQSSHRPLDLIRSDTSTQTSSAAPVPDVELLNPPLPHVWLGVELKARTPGQTGVLIERVLPGSPAERAQLLAGDVILSLGDRALSSPQDVSERVRLQPAHSTQPLLIDREGQRRLLRVKFDLMPEFEDRLRLAFVGRRAPEISGMVTFQGEVTSLKEMSGQVVILEFWASFCQVCRVLGPTLDSWHREFNARGAHVIGITVDTPQIGLEVARRAQMGYTLASDSEAEITRTYMASQIPAVFIIDGRGTVRDVMVGYSADRIKTIHALIERLLVEEK